MSISERRGNRASIVGKNRAAAINTPWFPFAPPYHRGVSVRLGIRSGCKRSASIALRGDVIVFRLNARSPAKTGSDPAFRRNEAERVYIIEAADNPEVAGSNPAPATAKGAGNGAFRFPRFVICGPDVLAELAAPARLAAERAAQVVLLQADARVLEPGMSASAAPAPVERVCDESGRDRIASQVAAGRHELLVAADLARVRVGPEEVCAAAVTAVVVA